MKATMLANLDFIDTCVKELRARITKGDVPYDEKDGEDSGDHLILHDLAAASVRLELSCKLTRRRS